MEKLKSNFMSLEVGDLSEASAPIITATEESALEIVEETSSVKESSTSKTPLDKLDQLIQEGGDKSEFVQTLIACYGEKIVSRALRSYPLKSWPQMLTAKHCLLVIGAIGHQITIDDLEECYAQLKSGSISKAILQNAQIPYLRMWWCNSVKELPPYWLSHLINLFRSPLSLPIGTLLETHQGHKDRHLTYLYYDYLLKELAKKGDQTRPEFYLAPRELLAKFIAYAHPASTQIGMIVPIFNEQDGGDTTLYVLSDQIHGRGLNSYLFTPLYQNNEKPNLLLFRGTDDAHGAHRDLDPKGIGKTVYESYESSILHMVEQAQMRTGSIKLEIIGHSLGGVDAQRALISLTSPAYVTQVSEVSLFAYCSPRLDAKALSDWRKHLNAIAEKKKKFSIHLSFAHHENDLVTYVGHAHLSPEEVFFVRSNFFIVKSDSGISDSHLHHTAPFFRQGNFDTKTDNRSFLFIQNCSEEELEASMSRLEELKISSRWYLAYRSIFGENIEDLEERIERIRREQEQFHNFTEQNGQVTWFSWTVSWVQPLFYNVYGWIKGIPSPK